MTHFIIESSLFFLMVNALTYWLYVYDKRASQSGRWRVPEATLLMLALLGGSPAALIASKRLRHKTKKLSFRLKLILILILQGCALTVWIISQATAAGPHS